MGEARAHYTDMVMEEWEAVFRQAQVEQAYNLRLLDEYRRTDELPTPGAAITADVDMGEQEALLVSYCAARDICRDYWLYRQYQADLKATYKGIDEVADEVYDKDEDDVTSSALAAPDCHDEGAVTSAGAADNEEE